jgi:hypothetical protein
VDAFPKDKGRSHRTNQRRRPGQRKPFANVVDGFDAGRNGASVAVVPAHAYVVQPVAAERVNLLLAAIPLEDKLAFCSAWLAGKS